MNDKRMQEIRERLEKATESVFAAAAYSSDFPADIRYLLARVEALEGVVGRLPVLKDGARFVSGDTVYYCHPKGHVSSITPSAVDIEHEWSAHVGNDPDAGWHTITLSDCYSTREAALAAHRKGGA